MSNKELFKVVFTVPESHADLLRKVVGEVGAGEMGNYTHCSFSVKGIGRFRPEKGASPMIGSVGKFEEVKEERIEITCPKNLLIKLIEEIKKVHPYEEPAVDIYPLLIL
jgi:hypothetical protein